MTLAKRFFSGALAHATASAILLASALLATDGSSFSEKFEALPKAVKDTAHANMGEALPVSVGATKNDKGWDYQINTKLDGKYRNLVINEQGKLVAVKDEADLASIPGPAKAAIERQAGAARIVKLEKVTEDGVVSYGAVLKDQAQGTVVQLQIAADGTVKSR